MKPILFITEMVRAIMDGRKTKTRRIIKDKGFLQWVKVGFSDDFISDPENNWIDAASYRIGDILYVRETFGMLYGEPGWEDALYDYKADYNSKQIEGITESGHRWHPSLHMPKKAARLFLKVTNVRVERLQDISEADCYKEGCQRCMGLSACGGGCDSCESDNPIKWFKRLWDSTINKNELAKYGWNANPWVWVYEFEPCEKPQE